MLNKNAKKLFHHFLEWSKCLDMFFFVNNLRTVFTSELCIAINVHLDFISVPIINAQKLEAIDDNVGY